MTKDDMLRRDEALQFAINYTLRRRRTQRQTLDALSKKGFSQEDIDFVIERLREDLLIDDESYAEDFIQSRLAAKPVSRRLLEHKLRLGGISPDIIDRAAGSVSDETEYENALAMARKILPVYMRGAQAQIDDDTIIHKTVRRLMSRGYSCEDSREAVKEAANEIRLQRPEKDGY